MNRQKANALQSPLHYHLTLLLMFPNLPRFGLPDDLNASLFRIFVLLCPSLGSINCGQNFCLSLGPAGGAMGTVEDAAGASQRPELVRRSTISSVYLHLEKVVEV
nr:hypothetical protein Iba_chr10eCG14730 [Ipomoea batatas]